MKINYLYEAHFGDWSRSYTAGVLKALEKHDVVTIDATGKLALDIHSLVMDAPPCDFWYVFSIADKWVSPVVLRAEFTREQVVIHNHGGMETGDYEALLYGPKDTTVLPEILWKPNIHVLCNSRNSASEFRQYYGGAQCTVVGFPVEVPPDPGYLRFGIVVPGRLGFGKQTFLAAKILEPFKSQVIFCTGRDLSENTMAEVLGTAGYEVLRCFGHDYYDLLYRSKVGLTTTLADSLNLTVVEMVKCGVHTIVPDLPIFDYLPSFLKYSPYAVEQARKKIDIALECSWAERNPWMLPSLPQFSSEVFSENIQKFFAMYEERK